MAEALQVVKKKLKQWETAFYAVHQRKPGKDDIESSPQDIIDAYKKYGELKKQAPSKPAVEVWGSSLCKVKDGSTPSADQPKKKTKKPSVMSAIGKKLFQRANLAVGSESLNVSWKVTGPATQPGEDHTVNGAGPSDESEPAFEPFQDETSVGGTDSVKQPASDKENNMSLPSTDVFQAALKLTSKKSVSSGKAAASAKKDSIIVPHDAAEVPTSKICQVRSSFSQRSSFPVLPKGATLSSEDFSRELEGKPAKKKKPKAKPRFELSDDDDDDLFQVTTTASGGKQTSQDGNQGNHAASMSNDCVTTPPADHLGSTSAVAEKSSPFDFEPSIEPEPKVLPAKHFRMKSVCRKLPSVEETSNKRKRQDSGEDQNMVDNEGEVGWNDGQNEALMVNLEDSPNRPMVMAKRQKTADTSRSGPISNDNFVRLNFKSKGYRRRGGGMTGPAHKRMMWKEKMKARSESRGDVCFKCGQPGHWAKKCKGRAKRGAHNNSTSPTFKKRVNDEDFPTVAEAMAMSQGIQSSQPAPASFLSLESTGTVEEEPTTKWDTEDPEVIRQAWETAPAPPSMPALYDLEEDGSLPAPPEEVMKALNKFGYDSFRPGQEQAVMRILCGQSTLVVLSTGAGKSLCYQLPAYVYAQRQECITLVISPLVSLMEDQVTGLPPGIRGACLHTSMTKTQRERVIESLTEGKVHFLLVSPEALVGGHGSTGGSQWVSKLPPVAFACIDEVHCVSEWSHHFRPSYLRVCKILKERFGVQTMLGLTATATMVTAASVAQHLGIDNYQKATIRGSPVPNNLMLSVSRDENKDQALIALLQGERFSKCHSIIVYCTRRQQTSRISTLIRTCLKDSPYCGGILDQDDEEEVVETKKKKGKGKAKGKAVKKKVANAWDAECYHAGLTAAQRRRVQNAFMSGGLRVVVATVAFGMGLDKSDVRGIIHYNLPKSYESYVQEIGRAGRDGKTAHCHMFLDSEGQDMNELKRHIHSNTVDRFTIKRLVQKVFAECRCKELHDRHQQAAMECAMLDDDPWDEDGKEIVKTNPEDTESSTAVTETDASPCDERKRICPRHERAVPIEQTVQQLDMREEGISTLLCYLELHPKSWVENLQAVYATCSVQCYGGPLELQAVAKKCPPIAVAIAKEKKRGISHSKSNRIDFPVVEVSDVMGWDSGPVKRELKLLQWDLNSVSGPRKTGVLVEFSDLAFHLRSVGDLADCEVDEVVDFLNERVQTQEKTELFQLRNFCDTLHGVAHKNIWMCSEQVDEHRSRKLKSSILAYFDEQPHFEAGQVTMLSFAREMDVKKTSMLDEKVRCENEGQVRSDIVSFINIYSQEHSLSGRTIARIFHGIPSPCFPVDTWGRVRRFWRCHLDTDFNLLRKMATQECVRLR